MTVSTYSAHFLKEKYFFEKFYVHVRTRTACRRKMLSEIASARESSSSSTVASLRRPSRVAGSGQSYGSRRASHSHRPSISYRTDQFGRQVLRQKLENTYCMEPDDKDRFHPGLVEKMLGNCNRNSYYFNLLKALKNAVPGSSPSENSDNLFKYFVKCQLLCLVQWRRSCGGPGVLTPNFLAVGVQTCTYPHF